MNHSHVLYDSDPHFKIDPISRNIIDESSKKIRIIQHDHNSERFTFEIPRYVEGHDMASCNLVEIHYMNVGANTKIAKGGVYTVDDLQVKSDDDNVVVCSWLIPNGATQYVGTLQFLIRFSCVNESNAQVEYVWNTGIYNGISVSSGIYNSDSPSDNIVPPFNFVTTISGEQLKFFIGSQADYDALSADDKENLYALITDDGTVEFLDSFIPDVTALKEDMLGIKGGSVVVGKADHATTADHATSADSANNANNDGNGSEISTTYAKVEDVKNGNVTAKHAKNAEKSNIADTISGTERTVGVTAQATLWGVGVYCVICKISNMQVAVFVHVENNADEFTAMGKIWDFDITLRATTQRVNACCSSEDLGVEISYVYRITSK